MTDAAWTLFVEGPSDQRFLTCLLRHLDASPIMAAQIGGGISALPNVRPQMQRARADGRGIAVLVDADSNAAESRKKLGSTIEKHDLPIEKSFFLPNDKESGCLETLLEQIAVSEHREIYNCFDQYEGCLARQNSAYLRPDGKARIYAYCEALGIETHAKKRDYEDPVYWNLSAPALSPLKAFLRGLQTG